MEEVKRYIPMVYTHPRISIDDYELVMNEFERGNYVKYSDYQNLQQELERCIKLWTEKHELLEKKYRDDMSEKSNQIEGLCDRIFKQEHELERERAEKEELINTIKQCQQGFFDIKSMGEKIKDSFNKWEDIARAYWILTSNIIFRFERKEPLSECPPLVISTAEKEGKSNV